MAIFFGDISLVLIKLLACEVMLSNMFFQVYVVSPSPFFCRASCPNRYTGYDSLWSILVQFFHCMRELGSAPDEAMVEAAVKVK